MRIAFRFFCPYLALYYLGTLLSTTGFIVKGPADGYRRVSRLLNTWVATHVFHLNPAIVVHRPSGSTDTALDYTQNLCILAISVVIAIVGRDSMDDSGACMTGHCTRAQSIVFNRFGIGKTIHEAPQISICLRRTRHLQ